MDPNFGVFQQNIIYILMNITFLALINKNFDEALCILWSAILELSFRVGHRSTTTSE